ncbi:hypothetical protein C8J57DRAFT_1619088 [Mycena rebaudengoi]|nr:hypothetical protein C8J57DRAFT_1619088 [Mycena rebaudengoi]
MMASPDGEDVSPEAPPTGSPSPPVTMHMYPFNPNAVSGVRTKRKQVKNACTNCQRSSKRCDDARPCLRCVKYGISETCMDSVRRERRIGNRGPYRKKHRDGKEPNVAQASDAYLLGIHPHYPAPSGYNPGELTTYYPQFFLAPVPSNTGQEGYGAGAYQQPLPQLFPATFPVKPS